MSPESGSRWCLNMLKRVEIFLAPAAAGPRPANRLERWHRRVWAMHQVAAKMLPRCCHGRSYWILLNICSQRKCISRKKRKKTDELCWIAMDFSDFAVPNLWISTMLVAGDTAGSCLDHGDHGVLGRSNLRPPWGRAMCLVAPLEPLRVEGPENGPEVGPQCISCEGAVSWFMMRYHVCIYICFTNISIYLYIYIYICITMWEGLGKGSSIICKISIVYRQVIWFVGAELRSEVLLGQVPEIHHLAMKMSQQESNRHY